jgi:hypothetical protein
MAVSVGRPLHRRTHGYASLEMLIAVLQQLMVDAAEEGSSENPISSE